MTFDHTNKQGGRNNAWILSFSATVGVSGLTNSTEYAAPEYVYNTNFLHKKCTAEHIASLTAYLVSEEAEFITGQTYICDGGRSLAMKGSE